MKKYLKKVISACLSAVFLLSLAPAAHAYAPGDPFRKDLKAFIQDPEYRNYVEMMLDHYIRTDSDIQNALNGGFAAVFLFDGCSDNMNDPQLSDLSYYRVSGVCLAVRKNGAGDLQLVYFNEDASTIPDQPLKYGAWELPEVGEVGPATICDGTYQLYSVRHRGEYEALHMRSDYRDATIEAVYMTPDGGYTNYRASEINIHTRTSNHIATYGMWSAGCPLVGDGNAWDFKRLIHSTYHLTYDTFEVDNFVGTLTLDRQQLRQELYTMYKNPDAVDAFLEHSRKVQPDRYFLECSEETIFEEPEVRIAKADARLMSMPCSSEADARTVLLKNIPQDEKLTVNGSIRNAENEKWHIVTWDGASGYLSSADTKPETFASKFLDLILGT